MLIADDSEGVAVGMDLTFSGFPIGRVRRIELGADGAARIVVDVPRKDARWLRTSSVFTLTRGLVGGTTLKAYSGILADPPLPPDAERKVLIGDAQAEIPRLVTAAREMVENLTALTGADSALAQTLARLQSASAKLDAQLGGRRGALGMLLGDDAPRLLETLERTNRLLASADALVRRADEKLLGDAGLAGDARGALQQLQQLLAEARGSLQRVDAVLHEAEAVAKNARVATTDLGALRGEVESNLRKIERLVDEINRRWPFRREPEIRLP